jgi:hypothetical protein
MTPEAASALACIADFLFFSWLMMLVRRRHNHRGLRYRRSAFSIRRQTTPKRWGNDAILARASARKRSAATACVRRVGQSGMSLSHSISVAIASASAA